jgi:hypothetical protein
MNNQRGIIALLLVVGVVLVVGGLLVGLYLMNQPSKLAQKTADTTGTSELKSELNSLNTELEDGSFTQLDKDLQEL